MTRRRKFILAFLAASGIVVASLGVSQTQSSGGCGSCGSDAATPELEGGGDHHFPDGSHEIDEQ